MNKYIAHGLIFAAGLAIGGASTFFICRKLYNAKLEEEKEKDQQYYLELLGYSEESIDAPSEEDFETESSEVEEKTLTEEEIRNMTYTEFMNRKKNEAIRNTNRVRYDRIPRNFDPEPEVDEVTMAINNDNQDKDILIITSDQFAREHLGFDKETLLWWPANKILSTEDYEIVDVPDLIGTEWQDRIGEFEPNMVYVRNMIAEADYEIQEQHEDFYDYKE